MTDKGGCFGHKTWQSVEFPDVFPNRKRQRIIGMTFPRCDLSLGLEPSILTVLPPGDNVEYNLTNDCFNDDDVEYYLCSVYISGLDEFIKWASKHDKNKIVVGGYHPTTFPEDFTQHAFKIVRGPCDDFFATIAQSGQVVFGVTNYLNLPRRDLYDMACNQQIIPDKQKEDTVVSINTSLGCNTKPPCDFCCTPMMCAKLLSKPIEVVKNETLELVKYNPKFMFIRDENFTMQPDWRQRLILMHGILPNTKIYLFASANTFTKEAAKFMSENGVYMVCLGLEDPTVHYGKNRNLDNVVSWLKEYGIYVYLSFIVNPLNIIGRQKAEQFYKILMDRIFELAPEMICGNFLMPFRGTKIWDIYYAHVSREDYKFYDSKTPFLVHNEVVREKMKFFLFWYQWQYFTSDFYNSKVRKFDTGDTLHLRFLELYDVFRKKYELIWNERA
ncbi:MAG: hypothetical protein WC449_01805 [Candidatus Paceibacterota bacterium]